METCNRSRDRARIPTFIEALLRRPLILGASVSADWGTISPGKRLALRHTPSRDIVTIARPGTPGRTTEKLVAPETLRDRTAVIAIDLYFWDSTLTSAEETERSLQSLLDKAASHDLPVLLGNIPELLPGRQPMRNRINACLEALAARATGCRILDVDLLHRQVIRDGYLCIKGREHTIGELVPDGLHLAEIASDFLADEIRAALAGSRGEAA